MDSLTITDLSQFRYRVLCPLRAVQWEQIQHWARMPFEGLHFEVPVCRKQRRQFSFKLGYNLTSCALVHQLGEYRGIWERNVSGQRHMIQTEKNSPESSKCERELKIL